MRSRLLLFPAALVLIALGLGVSACGDDASGGSSLSGSIKVDGSSTVGPLTEAAAELFREENPDVKITVGISGTGGGFEKFCAGETDISDASRPIEPDEEKACREEGVEYGEAQVANDGIAVVVNPENDWASCLTTAELKKIWEPSSKVDNWNQVRSDFPDEQMELFGAGTDSGTFDYFTEQINGEEGASRKDYSPSEDDNVTVQDASYKPLSRPLLIYPSKQALQNEATAEFVKFYVDNYEEIARQAQFVPMTAEQAQKAKDTVTQLEG